MSSCTAETGLVAMDCMVVCCCCPCLVLQVTIFLFIRLPKKVIVKSKRIILERWQQRVAKKGVEVSTVKLEELLDGDSGGAFGGGCWGDDCKQRCFAVDDEAVWESLVEQEGFFWFGSFWGRSMQEDTVHGEDEMFAGLSFPVHLERV